MEIDEPASPSTAIVPITPNENNEALTSEEPPNKRRRKKSIVWEHFTIETVGAGCMRALCKQCKKSFAYITGSKLAGTSHLKRHIALGICPVSRQKNGASPYTPGAKTDPPKRRYRASSGFPSVPFDQERCSNEIAKMIIQHEYPLHIVEHPGFIDFVRTLQPQYSMVSFNTIQGECVAIYLREKQSLLNLISGIPGRVSLTLDLATSNLNLGYAFLTGHFIDGDWNLHRRILNVVMLPFPDSDYAFNQAAVSCLSDWHLENRLFTLTLDQSISNEAIIGNLRGLLSVKNSFMLNGQLLKGNCYACVLSRLAQEALGAMGEVIGRIRESVKYVKTSETHDEKFAELRQQLQVPSNKELIIDDQTKWNTTYQMLVAACELKEVFACLDTTDPVYKINPSIDDWKKVEILCTYLKLLFDAANILTSPTYPPAYAFYHEVSKIQLELTHASMSQDPFVSNLTRPLKEKFDQYWKECFLVLAIAVVMDPRFKMKLVEFSFSKIFGEDAGTWIKIVDDAVHELFLEYITPNLHLSSTFMDERDVGMSQSQIPHEVVLVPPQDGPSDGVAPGEVHPQGVQPEVPNQELKDEVQPEDVPPQEMHHQEVPPEEMDHHEVPPQGTQHQEVPSESQELPPQEMHPEEVLSQEVLTHELPTEEALSQEVAAQEMGMEVVSQEVHAEVVPQEVHTKEVVSEEVHTEVVPKEVHAEEVSCQEVSAREMHAQEVPIQEMQTEVLSREVPPQEMGAQVLSQEMHVEEPPQEMDTQVLSQEVHIQEEPQHMQTQEIESQEMHTQGVQSQEMHLQVLNQEMHAHEVHAQYLPLLTIGDGLSDFDVYISETSSQHMKSELDQYLEESLLPRVQEFDVLGWWKLNKLKYPTLSKMAADILSIPISTVSPDSVFDIERKKIDGYRSSLRPVTLEALICAKDWLQYGSSSSSSSMEIPNAVVKVEY